ncbi:MAG: NUDIX domain-containing protein [Lachnospiraceae bacterium]|nr:NUDIX domain-containing protein [Lachnospiraceae bacterium]
MELWDVYDHCFQKTGKIHERGNPLAPGDYHLVVAIFPVNSEGQILIQKRNPDLKLMPGIWAATGGSAIQGEEPWDACQRELKEELGLVATKENAEMVAAFKRIDSYNTIWLVHTDVTEQELVLQQEEVSDAKWVSVAELRTMAREGSFHYYRYLDWLLDYITGTQQQVK